VTARDAADQGRIGQGYSDTGLFYLDTAGTGPPVVFVHGFCQSSDYWAGFLTRISDAGMRGIAVDLPGFGRSAGCAGPFTMEGLASSLAQLFSEMGLGEAALVGSSMGGVVAQQFALAHGERLQRLALIATGPRSLAPDRALAQAEALSQSVWDQATVARLVTGFFHSVPPGWSLARSESIALLASREAAVEALRSNGLSDTRNRLPGVTLPTLVIQGGLDPGRTPEIGRELVELLSDARLVVLPESGHTPQMEQPDALWAELGPFLRSVT